MSHDNQEALDETWEEADAEADGSAWLRKQNRRRSQQQVKGRERREQAAEPDEVRARPAAHRQRPNKPEEFRCRHCRMMVGLVPSGGRHRNHCPYCLHSRHVDERMPGDRLSPCGGTMAPIGHFTRPNGEYGLVHHCLACGVRRHNRIAADDDFDLVLALPDMTHWEQEQQALVEETAENTI
ncbi:MAG TPA: RNHCP domain-containing protein [Ktedonobacterales bacterium]